MPGAICTNAPNCSSRCTTPFTTVPTGNCRATPMGFWFSFQARNLDKNFALGPFLAANALDQGGIGPFVDPPAGEGSHQRRDDAFERI